MVILEGLVLEIVWGVVLESIKNKRVISLDFGLFIVGVKFRGDFEERLKKVLIEVEQVNGEVIFFIDEFYIFLGFGKVEGFIDVFNFLKFVFLRGEFQCCGVMIFVEYCLIEKDVVFVWRF